MQLRKNRAGFTGKTVLSGRARPSCAHRHTSHAALLAILAAGAAHAGATPGIVPDGATHTSVTTSSNGRQTVSIAPATYGVFSNTYSNFNVTQAGATLNNTSANARTIVNQITLSTGASPNDNINDWPSPANEQIANPNAIAMDVEPADSITAGGINLIATDLGAKSSKSNRFRWEAVVLAAMNRTRPSDHRVHDYGLGAGNDEHAESDFGLEPLSRVKSDYFEPTVGELEPATLSQPKIPTRSPRSIF